MNLCIRPSLLCGQGVTGSPFGGRDFAGAGHCWPPAARRCALVSCLLAICISSGCGTREYERRLAARLVNQQQKEKEAKLVGLLPPRVAAGSRVSVRMPEVFEGPLYEDGKPVRKKAVDLLRAEPWKFTLPVLNLTYEAPVEDLAGGKQYYYGYVGVKDPCDGNLASVTQQVRDDMLKVAAGKNPPTVSDVQLETIDGQKITWQKIRCEIDQEFYYVDNSGKKQYLLMPGIFEVWLHEEAGVLVVIAWRTPKAAELYVGGAGKADEQPKGLAKWAPLVASCVSKTP